ncbi:phage protein Gp36 family protein [Stutzerimonas kunmingensis]|uniref:DUF1320 family protein n=1 Tax=Stutzerimonas kunmingensis TaxID=1211807 RepID=A0A9X1N670_9GAMM|nr:phage protein Gp36 family protein [Stutzerimonas kunmingensis]MCD1608626.1 DUF1320 family protein [Stutzerimonas kunmingensis]
MTYATYIDYKSEFGDDDLQDGSEARVHLALQRASKLADTYMRSAGIEVPTSDATVIADIRGSVLDISRYFCWPDNTSDEIRKRYEDAIKFLESVASGKISLIIKDGQVSNGDGFRNIRLIRA